MICLCLPVIYNTVGLSHECNIVSDWLILYIQVKQLYYVGCLCDKELQRPSLVARQLESFILLVTPY